MVQARGRMTVSLVAGMTPIFAIIASPRRPSVSSVLMAATIDTSPSAPAVIALKALPEKNRRSARTVRQLVAKIVNPPSQSGAFLSSKAGKSNFIPSRVAWRD